MNRRNLPIILSVLLILGFAAGVLKLFELRFEAGDVYPAYSTLRADPLGASAFFESLDMLPGISARRDLSANNKLPDGAGTTYLHLAGDADEWDEMPEATFKEIERFVREGGRLVVALAPETVKPHFPGIRNKSGQDKKATEPETNAPPKLEPKAEPKPTNPAKERKKKLNEKDELFRLASIGERWGIHFDIKDLKQGAGTAYEPLRVVNQTEHALPEALSWHSGGIMTNLDKAWRVIYARGPDAVLAERRFGLGTVVFSTDSYYLSNEAMQKDPQAELLAWIVGPNRRVIFDEAHLGILEQPGIAALLRKYRLHGFVAGALLLAGLFIWKNAMGFGPVREEETTAAFVAGKDAASGFVNLLRHHVKSQDILNTCVAEWRKSLPPGKFSSSRIERVESLMQKENALPPRERNPVRAYREICSILKQAPELRTPNPETQTYSQKT